MQLDPEKSYLLVRPSGGTNDQLVQIEKATIYAEKYARVLIIDTARTGIRETYTSLFEIPDDFGVEVLIWNDELAHACDAVTSVYPPSLRGMVSSYKKKWLASHGVIVARHSGELLAFDHACDHDAQLLVCEQVGGGLAGFRALRRVRLQPDVAKIVAKRLVQLGSDYDAVHIRHSDYQTQFARFLRRIRPALKHRRVLICSDSVGAKQAAQTILDPSTNVLSVADIPDLDGAPLHRAMDIDAHEANINLLCDLLAMGLCEQLFFTRVRLAKSNGATYSGFSILAEMLRRNKGLVKQLLMHADAADLDALFAQYKAEPMQRGRFQRFLRNFLNPEVGATHKDMEIIEGFGSIAPEAISAATSQRPPPPIDAQTKRRLARAKSTA